MLTKASQLVEIILGNLLPGASGIATVTLAKKKSEIF